MRRTIARYLVVALIQTLRCIDVKVVTLLPSMSYFYSMISFRLRKDFLPSATSVKRGSSRSRRGRSSRTWTPSVSRWHQASQTVNLGQTVLDDLLQRKSIAARQVLADACLGGGHCAAGQERGKNKASCKKSVKIEKSVEFLSIIAHNSQKR